MSNNYAPDPNSNRVTPWTTAQLRTICEEHNRDGSYDFPENCDADLDDDQFCAAAYLSALESGFEFWPEHTKPSLCPMHWQHLLDRSTKYDADRALANATAYAQALYGAVEHQMRRAARKSALEP